MCTPPAKSNNPVGSRAVPLLLLPTTAPSQFLGKASPGPVWCQVCYKTNHGTSVFKEENKSTRKGEKKKKLHTSLAWKMYLVLPEPIRWGDPGNLLFCQYLLF